MGAATSRWDVAQRPTEPAGETKPQDLPGLQGVLVPGGHRSGPVYVATSVGAGRLPLADSTRGGSRDRSPCLPLLPKKGGTYVPLLGWHRARGFCLWKGRAGCQRARASPYRPTGACGRCPALFPPAAPVKAVERCSTPRKLLKKVAASRWDASSD